MKTKLLWAMLAIFTLGFTACGDDDETPEEMMTTDDDGGMTDDGDNGMAELIAAQEMTTTSLTGGDEKVWRITQAVLNNASGTIDISNNFNVVDDEFIFSGTRTNGSLEWRQGNAIGVDGTTSDQTLLDFYKAPINSSFSFDADSSSTLSGLDGDLTFEVVNDNTITGTLTFNEGRRAGETLDLTLSQKTLDDYASAPENGLDFSLITTFQATGAIAGGNNVGFIGSNANNSMYIAYRNDIATARSRILRYNLDQGSFSERNDTWNDFFTRKLNIVNNEIVLTGGQNIYTYDLELINDPTITPHNAGALSRFSTSVIESDIYVVGGDLDVVADKLRRVNSQTGALDVVNLMPSPKVHAGSAFVQDNLYIFSGREVFFDNETVTTESFVYNLSNEEFTTFDLPVALNNSYASAKENLIYIVGDIQVDTDGDGNVDNYDIWMGVYDTLDGSIQELTNNVDDSDQFSYVHAMTIFRDKMYVIYGSSEIAPNEDEKTWQILAADLN